MTTVTLAIPENLDLHEGDEVRFNALVQRDGTFVATHVTRPLSAGALKDVGQAPATLGEWARKWAGVAVSEADAGPENVKRAAYLRRFGA